MSDGDHGLGFALFSFFQLALLVCGFLVVSDAQADGAWWWDAPASGAAPDAAPPGGNNSTAALFQAFGTDVGHTPAMVGLGVAQVALLGVAAHRHARRPLDPLDRQALQRELARRGEMIERLRGQIQETHDELRHTQETLRAERAQHQRLLDGIPPGIMQYYQNGFDGQRGIEEIHRAALRERHAWDALSHTFHTGAVAPLLAALSAVPEDHAAGTHHYSTEEVLALLVRISSELRENDWMAKALRWVEAKYGSS